MEFSATYSPEDNKLRLSASSRLDVETYARVKAAGFIWAPKQGIFVAPMWTPSRADLAMELAGEIGDEDTSLVDRAEERAERFEGYRENRTEDAHTAKAAVDRIADGIPLGQPILVGHHSERHARKDAERIENGMRRAVKMWETAEYWKYRAAGAIRHAKYKELPAVRARRIKGIEADQRKNVKANAEAQRQLELWGVEPLTMERALAITNRCHVSACFPLAKYPRELPASQYEGSMSLWSALDGGIITAEQARDLAVPCHQRGILWRNRWLEHYGFRLEYERAMLAESGAMGLLEPKPRTKQLPLCNYRAADGIQTANIYHRGETIHYPQVEMTQAQYAAINVDYKGTRVVEGSHRVRIAMVRMSSVSVFLTDSKEHEKPAPVDRTAALEELADSRPQRAYVAPPPPTEFDAMKEALRKGVAVQVVSAPQLFPTPADLARRMVEAAGIEDGMCVLEPSAGTGNLVRAVLDAVDTEVLAYEINQALCSTLSRTFPSHKMQVRCKDFLEVTDFMGCYPRVLMNPPFVNGADIQHITHAVKFLKPGGRLVAICANGPRQREQLKPLAEQSGGYWEDLPVGSFSEQGTNVNTAMVVIEAQ